MYCKIITSHRLDVSMIVKASDSKKLLERCSAATPLMPPRQLYLRTAIMLGFSRLDKRTLSSHYTLP